MRTVFLHTLQEKLSSTSMLVLLALIVVVVPAAFYDGELIAASWIVGPPAFVLLVGAGSIGGPEAQGTLALVFCRPVRRSDWVSARWLAIVILCVALSLVQLGAQAIALRVGGYPVTGPALLQNGLARVSVCVGMTAVLMMLSSMLRSQWDAAAWATIWLMAQFAGTLESERLTVTAQAVLTVWLPELHLRGVPSIVLGYFATVTAALSVAMWFVGRKELSYGS